ncbi:MAG: DEAD/DEAH box helicase, partial [Sphingopyxis sp.]|nr:DEAD/DEAH box helicase [Sphingopyxis sp.]
DEADRMLDMGFIPDIEEICTKLPGDRQTLLFSATMPGPIKKLADRFLSNPKSIEVARPASSNLQITQALIKVDERKKGDVVRRILRSEPSMSTIIFCNRKTMVRDLAKSLKRDGFASGEIHGDMDQSSRIAELERFKSGDINVLVASDVAARGIDVKGVSHVINYDTPWHPDDYVHRIGRTGRAGATGHAYTLVTDKDAEAIDNVQKLIGVKIEWAEDFGSRPAASAAAGEIEAERPRSGRKKATPARAARDDKPAPAKAERDDEPTPAKAEPEERLARARADSQDKLARARAEREDKPVRESRPRTDSKSEAKPEKSKPRKADPAPDSDGDGEGGWNGPVPGFLGFGFGN